MALVDNENKVDSLHGASAGIRDWGICLALAHILHLSSHWSLSRAHHQGSNPHLSQGWEGTDNHLLLPDVGGQSKTRAELCGPVDKVSGRALPLCFSEIMNQFGRVVLAEVFS